MSYQIHDASDCIFIGVKERKFGYYSKCRHPKNKGKACIRLKRVNNRKFEPNDVKCPLHTPKRVDMKVPKSGGIYRSRSGVSPNMSEMYHRILEALLLRSWTVESGVASGSKSKKKGGYHFIPRRPDYIVNVLHTAKRIWKANEGKWQARRPKLLDCGAGIGNVMLMANELGFDAYGIEFDKQTVSRGRQYLKLFGWRSSYNHKQQEGSYVENLFQGDLLTFDKFGEFDVLYAYLPLENPDLERRFEIRAVKQAKPNTVIVGLPFYHRRRERTGCFLQEVIVNNHSNCWFIKRTI